MLVIRLFRTVALAALLVVTAFSGTALAVDISVTGHSMMPNPATAEVGEVVVFINDTGETLRLVDGDERWDSGDLAPGATFQITFNEPGTFEFSSIDGAVSGAVEVREAGAEGQSDGAGTGEGEDGAPETTALAATGASSAQIAGAGLLAVALGLLALGLSGSGFVPPGRVSQG